VNKKPLPKEVVEHWPEVFQDIDVKAIPLEYLESMRIIFSDGNSWFFKIPAKSRKDDIESVQENLEEIIETYRDTIEHIDFRLDIKKVKKDIVKKTNSFLKNKK
jgi:hypothetical protein